MAGLSSITIKGYKSIRALEDFPLTNINVLIGANGAGKSNFIGLFRLLKAINDDQIESFTQVEGGAEVLLHFGQKKTDKLIIEINGSSNRNAFQFTLIPTKSGRLSYSSISNINKNNHNIEKSILPLSVDFRVYHFHDTSDSAKVKQIHADNDNLLLKPDGANLAAYLLMLQKTHPESYQNIVHTIQLVAPFFDGFVNRADAQGNIQLEWFQKGNPDTPFKAHMLSDGTLRFICLTTLLYQPVKLLPDTLLIDEPELGLHPYAVSILVSMMKRVAEDKQLIVSTQSVELVNALAPEDVIVVEQDDGASTFKRLDSNELKEWLNDYQLGELWKMNIVGGRP